MDRTPSRLHGRSESSPKHFSIELYYPVSPLASPGDLSLKKKKWSSKLEYRIRTHILQELNMQAQNPIEVREEKHKTCAHILWELNM